MQDDVASLRLTVAGESDSRRNAGSMSDFEQLIRRHEKKVIMTALRLLGNLEDAQDAAQEVFLRLHKYRHRFDESRELAPWLYKVTVYVCHDLRGKRREIPAEDARELAADGPSADVVMEREDQRRALHRALQQLPRQQRAAIVLRDIEGLTTDVVAAALGMSAATVRSHISMARLRLRKLLGRDSA